ncbi:MAG TPA: long-chain fatty acid--CoA ligase, partial [Alphaproteobacteria bacterium]|nr:long-chain fatty acid--CoA ligase [Alphaproteobacteria bacterium]
SHRHGILNEDIGDTRELVISFLDALAPVALEGAPHRRDAANPVAEISRGFPRSMQTLLAQLRRARPFATSRKARLYPWERAYPSGVDWRANIEVRSLTAMLDDAVERYAENICASFRGKKYTYREIGTLIERAAAGFRAHGVDKGINVGLMLPNCPYAVICFYAVLKAGGTVVNINPLCAAPEIAKQIADSGLRLLVTMDIKGLYDKIAALARDGNPIERIVVCRMSGALRFTEKVLFDFLKTREVAAIPCDDRHVPFERLIDNDGMIDPSEIDPAIDVAVLQYTGGTTGFPKAARLTHANLFINATQIGRWAPLARSGEEKFLAVLPLFHSFGMTAVMNVSLLVGAEMVLLAKFQPSEVLEAITREKPTVFIGVPTMFSALNAAFDRAKHDMSSLKFCISGGAPLPREVQRRFEENSGCGLAEGYGLSEASPVCTINPLDEGGRPGSVGLPLPGTVIEIVALDDPGRVLATGERGEICVTGPQVMLGYANRAKENIDVFRGGRLHTGDVGYMDAEGYIYIVDRIKDLILSGGFNVYPRMVEEAILLHPAVNEAAVCGVPDRHRGEIVKAFVTLREGQKLTGPELRDFLRDKLAPFQTPRRIEFRTALPRTPIGKISRKDLRTAEMSAAAAPEIVQTAET